MSTGYINTADDTDMAECEGEKVVTMMDVLQEQEEFEEDANAVLGASDDKNCTYSKGYIKRQAVYACLTCCSDAKNDPTKRAGVCLACSLNCHENHELIELYTRRNFRCDCGNPKFNSHPCQFTPNKTDLNEDNKYNQNFIGIYCTCHRPYPDPDAMFEDEMIQCTICEDWLHASHLEATLPGNDQYSEMICKACMDMNEFLHDYSSLSVNVDVDVCITLNETVTVKSNLNEKLPNGSFGLSPTNQENGKEENINISMKIYDKNEAMEYIISSNTTNNEKESIAFSNGTVIASNGNTENEIEKQKMLQIENISNSKEVHLEADDVTVTENTDEVEEEILNTNTTVALNDTLNASDKGNMSMETEESPVSQQRYTDNIQKGCISTCTTISDLALVDTNIENESICGSEKSNFEESSLASSDRINTRKVTTINENETLSKYENTKENTLMEHTENNFDLEKSNCESTGENFRKVEEIETVIVPKTDLKDPTQSSDINSEIATALKDLVGDELKDVIKGSSAEQMDEEFDKRNSSQSTEVVSDLKNEERNQSEQIFKDFPMEGTEKKTLQSTEISSEIDTALNILESSKLDGNTEEHSAETIDKKTDSMDIPEFTEVGTNIALNNSDNIKSGTNTEKQSTKSVDNETDISESTEVNTNIDIALDNLKNSLSGTKTDDQPTELLDKETGKLDISESIIVNTNMDIALDSLKDSESGTKTEDQSTELIDIETGKIDISESTTTNTNMDITLDSLKDSESGTKTEDQSTESIDKETNKKDNPEYTKVDTNIDTILNNVEDTETIHKKKKDISESTEVFSNIDTMLNDLENSEPGNKTAKQSIESIDKEVDKKDMLDSVKVDSNIDTIFNNSKTNTEKEDTPKLDDNIYEESVDQSDTLEKATMELLELTSDMVEDSEEDLLLESNYTADTNKELNSREEVSENKLPVEIDNKGNPDIEINNIKTGEYLNRNYISQVESPSCNNVQTENTHKRKCYEGNDDVEIKKAKIGEKTCLRPKGVQRIFRGATFWPSDFRQKLCTCNECLTMYKDLRLLFLLDPEDTVTAYETLGKEKIEGTPTTQYEKGLQALSSLGRVQQINALTEYNIMRDKLLDFLKSFKERKEVVKEEDIRAFFAGMKPRREPDGVYFCR